MLIVFFFDCHRIKLPGQASQLGPISPNSASNQYQLHSGSQSQTPKQKTKTQKKSAKILANRNWNTLGGVQPVNPFIF